MNIVFEKISLENFLSFKHAEITLDNNGYVVVSGINRYVTDGAKSNGAGKSTIWDAITWCLTGETIRGVKDVVNNLFKDEGCYVELHFTVNSKHFCLLRSKDHKMYKTNLKITINNVDKSGKGIRDSEKLLAEYLPDLTASFIGSVIILGQGLPERFTNNTPAGRKDILEKLSKSDFMINDIKQAVSTRQTALQQELRAVQDDSISNTSKHQLLTAQQVILKDKLANIGTATIFREELSKCDADKEVIEDDLNAVTRDKFTVNNSIQYVRKTYTELGQTYQQDVQELSNTYDDTIQQLVTKQANIKAKIDRLDSKIAELSIIKDVCPTCGQRIPGVIKPDTSKQKISVAQARQELAQISSELLTLRDKKQEEKRVLDENFTKHKADLIKRGDELDLQLRQLDTSYVTLTGQKTELENKSYMLQSKIENFNQTLTQLTDNINNNDQILVDLSNKILYNKSREEDISLHIDAVNKMNTIATRDFRGHLLTNIIEFINKQAISYSQDIFGTDKISIVLEGNNIEIGYDNKSYAGLSGGERQKVDIIVQLAIRDMLSTFMGYSCNILVLDEIFDNLDNTGCEHLLNLFAKKLSDLSSIYIISHHADSLNIPYDKELIVVKNETGFSEIQ